MQPLKLTLKGFRGIRYGLGQDVLTLDFERLADGAELVAIAGANGRGKTTLMDNMHPYLTMPSRAALSGPGGFSYYDHVCLPENEKDLTWSHEGRCYRSQVVIRLNGRRKTEAYLHALSDEGQWRPVCLDDGLVSDGKVETYSRCVESICGSADTFFTSAFSAQGKRQLSTYRNAEIKSLLSDLLGQEEIRALGQKANDTAKLIKAGLSAIRQELAGLDAEQARLDAGLHRLQGASDRVAQTLIERQQALQALDGHRVGHARLQAQRDQSQSTEARRAQLLEERKALIVAGTRAIEGLKAQEQDALQGLERLAQRINSRRTQAQSRQSALMQSRRQCLNVLEEADAIQRAAHRLALSTAEQAHLAAERDAQSRIELMAQARALAERRVQVQSRMARAEDSLGSWNLFARCMSNDGLIALAIDDAGPALSGLANDLLLACYGPRFTVSILTLVETGKGEQREGFDIVVHDGESGDSKSLGLMSGGERVWVNECLTRAVALYLAQHAGRRYDALFSDEADGALDPERKRMFMAMKREVLRVGGYQREFFVSQTPELTAMADAVIDLDAMRDRGVTVDGAKKWASA